MDLATQIAVTQETLKFHDAKWIKAKNFIGPRMLDEGTKLPVGGKTGTGDNQHKKLDPDGMVISSKVINRTATFAFIIGDRFFGNITAYVPGPQAGEYSFTSSLPVALLKNLAVHLNGILDTSEISKLNASELPRRARG